MEEVLNRTVAPAISEVEKIDVLQARKFSLDNGIPVFAITAGFQDLVKVELIFYNTPFDMQAPLLNSAANRMLAEGTTKYSAQQLADHIDYYGAFLETDENYDYTSIVLYTLNKHFKSVLPFLSDIINDAVFPERELGIYAQNNKQRLLVDNEKVNSLVRRKFNEVIFGDKHGYGYFVIPEDYDKLKRGDLLNQKKAKYHSSNCTIIISGLVKDDSVNELNKYFGRQQSSNGIQSKEVSTPFASSSVKRHLIYKEVVQSAIRIGKPFFNRTHADFPGMAVLNTILGGFFGSRLMANIREDKGFTYSIGSAIVSMRQQGYFFISTEVGAEVTQAAIDEIYHEIDRLRREPVAEEELAMARNYMLGSFLKGIDGAFQLAERFKSIHLYGLDYYYYDRYIEKIRTIDADEIQRLAVKYLDLNEFYEVVVGRK